MNVDDMLDEIDSTQLMEWMAFEAWEMEQEQRAEMAAKAESQLEALKRQRNR